MKKLMIAFASVCMLFAASSCKKSMECCNNGNCIDVSQDDYGSKALYDAAISSYRANGYTCK